MDLTEVGDGEASGGVQGPPHPALPQHLQVVLLPLDQQDVLVYPSQEEGLAHRLGHPPAPHVLVRVLRFEVREDLVSSVVPRQRVALRHPGGAARLPGPDPGQDDGQGVRGDLQERLHGASLLLAVSRAHWDHGGTVTTRRSAQHQTSVSVLLAEARLG